MPRRTSKALRLCASAVGRVRDELLLALSSPRSAVAERARGWRARHLPAADDGQLADAWAQALLYALLLARAGPDLAQLPGPPILAAPRAILGDAQARGELGAALGLLEQAVAALEPARFARRPGDPWLAFQEEFLAAYDPALRSLRGVYATPPEVVGCQVRLVARLLAERLGKPLAFVDEGVVTLDPATGSGAYILAALRHGLEQAAAQGAAARAAAATVAARNIYACELLAGPCAVAQLRFSQEIIAAGGALPPGGARIACGDALEAAGPGGGAGEPAVVVCIGNPPYGRQIVDPADPERGRRARARLDDFLAPLAADLAVHAKSLYNDYVHFWRWAIWQACERRPGPGIVSLITASAYLRGPGFAGMRELLRRAFDELWIIDLEGDNLGARRTENIFAIQTPVAIAIGLLSGVQRPDTPAAVRYTRISGSRREKLAALDAVSSLADLPWRTCLSGWRDHLLPTSGTPYWSWPLLPDIFPWQTSGMQFKRSWPIGESPDLPARRWEALLASDERARLFKESRDRKVTDRHSALDGSGARLPSVQSLPAGSPAPRPQRVAYRSFDRQWALVDPRLGDYLRPALQRAHGDRQIYLTSLLTRVLGPGPAAVATALPPDMDHFCNRGARDVIPLWRNREASAANITAGLLEQLTATYGQPVAPDELFAYAYALLATPHYVRRFWDELTVPGPRLPITKDAGLFAEAAGLGRRLIWLHTYGERLAPDGETGRVVPPGHARVAAGVPPGAADYPEDFEYNAATQELRVGKGLFRAVRPEVWSFSVSGLHVVASWLGYRMRRRAGRSSSPLDEIRPEAWRLDAELLDLLWVLDHTVDLMPQASELLERVLAGAIFQTGELPQPGAGERSGPQPPGDAASQRCAGFDQADADRADDV